MAPRRLVEALDVDGLEFAGAHEMVDGRHDLFRLESEVIAQAQHRAHAVRDRAAAHEVDDVVEEVDVVAGRRGEEGFGGEEVLRDGARSDLTG